VTSGIENVTGLNPLISHGVEADGDSQLLSD
jgi:hypothetical protein